jgi:hypothetical protein
MTFIPDLSEQVFFPAKQDVGREVRSIGWLGDHVPSRGTVGPAALAAIKYFRTAHRRGDPFRGVHFCEICRQVVGREEFFIDLGGVRYILPQMVVHYIEDHGTRRRATSWSNSNGSGRRRARSWSKRIRVRHPFCHPTRRASSSWMGTKGGRTWLRRRRACYPAIQ